MKDERAAPRGRGDNRRKTRRTPPRGSDARLLVIGWVFLGVVLALAVAAIALLLPGRDRAGESGPAPSAVPAVNAPGSAFATDQTAPPLTIADGTGGRLVDIRRIRCDFTEPAELTFGVLRSVDLTAAAETVVENVGSAGWGAVTYSVTDDGSLLLRAENQTVLTGDAFARQEAFLASAQPENLARTFLDNSGLIPLLRAYGLTLTNYAENNDGMITFRGTGNTPQAECSIRFSFLYTGAFNQAVLRAVYLDGAVTTGEVLSLPKAAGQAVTWGSAETGATDVVDAELRYIRGLPFYVLTCQDGTVAYALAVSESALDLVPGARELYQEMMHEGIQEYVELPGAAF